MKQEKIKFVTLTYCNDNKTYVKADTIVQLSEIDGKTYVYTINDNVPIIVKERVDEILAKIGGEKITNPDCLMQEPNYNSVNSLVESKLKNPKAKTFDILHFIADNAGLSTYEAIEKAYNMGVSEQEPCEDCISRQASIEAVKDLCKYYTPTKSVNHPHMDFVIQTLQDLPPVNPQPKTGCWILTIEDWNKWTCSECGFTKRTDIHVALGYNFCPNCGAKMAESEEV